MASMRKKKGHYYARFYDPNQRPKRKEVALRTTRKDVARRRLTEMEKKWERGEFDPWAPSSGLEHVSVTEAIDRFLEAKRHLRPRTRETYAELLEKWTRRLPPGLRLRDVGAEHLRPYVLDGSIRRASQCKRYRHLGVFLNWSVEAGLISVSPLNDVRKPKKKKKAVAFLSPDDLEKLLRSIDAHYEITQSATGKKPDDDWLKAMIKVAVCTGLRRGELCRLRWRDVDLRHRLLTVRSRNGEETKSGDERQLQLVGDALEALQRLDAERTSDLDAPVFTDRRGRPITLDRATKRFKFFVRKAKLPDRDRLHFHSLRHTCGSWLAMKGVPQVVIQAILGHREASTTEIYMHHAPQAMAAALEETFG